MRRLFSLWILLVGCVAYGDTWHSNDAKLLATGTLKSVDGDSIQILKADSSTADFKLDTLAISDRAAVLDRGNGLSEFKHPVRSWTSASGTFHVDAKAISFDDQSARLVLADNKDNKVVSVQLDKLSKDDRDYLDRLKKLIAKREINPFVAEQPNSLDSVVDNTPAAAAAVSKSPSSTPTTRKPTISNLYDTPPSTHATPAADDPNRNPHNETPTGQTATGIPQFTGPNGGTYHYSKSGNKVYDKRK